MGNKLNGPAEQPNGSRLDAAAVFARMFEGPEHKPFRLEGGRPAALLVHGFPGSPAEMRPLGETLNRAGWTVEGPLLPGFGPDVATITERTYADWVNAARTALRRLQKDHYPVLVGGFSMGASISMQVAASEKPQGALLLAPFVRLPGPLWHLLPLFHLLFPTIRPFRWFQPDFSDPRARQGMQEFMPGVDVNDPAFRRAVRDFEVPTGIFNELRKMGLAAQKAVPDLDVQALIVQGRRDRLVAPKLTRELLARLPARLAYLEVDGEHDLPQTDKPAWPQVSAAAARFAAEIARRNGRPHEPESEEGASHVAAQ